MKELHLKCMVVTDECLELIARSFNNFKVLMLSFCEGVSTVGLVAIAANCRSLSLSLSLPPSPLYVSYFLLLVSVCVLGAGLGVEMSLF